MNLSLCYGSLARSFLGWELLIMTAVAIIVLNVEGQGKLASAASAAGLQATCSKACLAAAAASGCVWYKKGGSRSENALDNTCRSRPCTHTHSQEL